MSAATTVVSMPFIPLAYGNLVSPYLIIGDHEVCKPLTVHGVVILEQHCALTLQFKGFYSTLLRV